MPGTKPEDTTAKNSCYRKGDCHKKKKKTQTQQHSSNKNEKKEKKEKKKKKKDEHLSIYVLVGSCIYIFSDQLNFLKGVLEPQQN